MSALGKLIEREITLISRFVTSLQEEQEALKAANPVSLPTIHEEKSRLVDQLNALENERIQLVGGSGNMPDRERMAAWLQAHPNEKTVAGHWKKLIELAQEAKHLSDLNAALVKLHLEKTSQALAILTRHAQENLFYGSDGQAATYTGSRIVDSA